MSSRGVPPPCDGNYVRLEGGSAVRLDRRSELTADVFGFLSVAAPLGGATPPSELTGEAASERSRGE